MLWLLVANLTFAADPMSTQELVTRKPQWDKLVGATLTVEGRTSAVLGTEFRLVGCDLKFVLEENVARPRNRPQLIVTGRLEPVGSGFQFRVTSLADGKPEADVVNDKLRAGDQNDPVLLASLGDWVANRAEFYNDPELRQLKVTLYERGVRAAEAKVPIDDADGYVRLATEVQQRGLSEELRSELLHAASRADLTVEARRTKPEYAIVQQRIRTRFPAAATPLQAYPEQLAKAYEASPIAAYESADAPTRTIYQRLLYIEATQRLVRRQTLPDGSNGFQVAGLIESLIPELAAQAAPHREAELKFRESRIGTMSREEILEFKATLRRLEQAPRATQAVKRWIDLRYAGLPDTPANNLKRAQD
jgi:hypothetical protein